MFNQALKQNQFYELRIQQLEQTIMQKDMEIAFLKQQLNSLGININYPFGFNNNVNNIMNQNQMMFMNNSMNKNENNYDFIEDYGHIQIETTGLIKEKFECFIYDKAIILMSNILKKLNKNLKDLKFIFLGDIVKEIQPQITLGEIGIFDGSTIDVRERDDYNAQLENNILGEKTHFHHKNLVFNSTSTGNKSTLVLNENIPVGIALILYLIKSGRETDLFNIIQNKSDISFIYNSKKIGIDDKTRIKYFFNNFIHQIDIIRHKATNN